MFVEIEKTSDSSWVKTQELRSYVPYRQWGIIKIQPNGDRREGRDLRPSWGIHEQTRNQTTFRSLGHSLPECLWSLFVHFLGKKWPEEI